MHICGIRSSTDMLAATVNVTASMNNALYGHIMTAISTQHRLMTYTGINGMKATIVLNRRGHRERCLWQGVGAIGVTTTLSGGGGGMVDYADMWDDNRSTIPVSFETGYNATETLSDGMREMMVGIMIQRMVPALRVR